MFNINWSSRLIRDGSITPSQKQRFCLLAKLSFIPYLHRLKYKRWWIVVIYVGTDVAFVDGVELRELGYLLEFGDLDSIAGVAAGVKDAEGGIIDMLNINN